MGTDALLLLQQLVFLLQDEEVVLLHRQEGTRLHVLHQLYLRVGPLSYLLYF